MRRKKKILKTSGTDSLQLTANDRVDAPQLPQCYTMHPQPSPHPQCCSACTNPVPQQHSAALHPYSDGKLLRVRQEVGERGGGGKGEGGEVRENEEWAGG